jgi:hypothetical protein
MKFFAPSSLAVAALFSGAVVVVACSDENPGAEFPEQVPGTDAGPDAPGTLVPVEGGGADSAKEAGPASCPPAIPAAFAPVWKAPVKSAACTAEELKGYWDACLANPANTEGDGTCMKFKTDHATCGACAEPDDKSGPIQWQLDRKFYTLNVAGCIAVAQTQAGLPEPEKCGEAYNAAVQCGRDSCSYCFGLGGSFNQFTECQKAVGAQGICKSYETSQAAACTGYKNAGSPALACFNNGGGEATELHFTRVVGLVCGPST